VEQSIAYTPFFHTDTSLTNSSLFFLQPPPYLFETRSRLVVLWLTSPSNHIVVISLHFLFDINVPRTYVARMPKNKKSKGNKVAAAQTDEDFDAMLAELRATDLITVTATSRSSGSGTSSSSSSSFTPAAGNVEYISTEEEVSEEAAEEEISEECYRELVQACIHGDVPKLQCWARRGVRLVSSGLLLVLAARNGELEVMRCLVTALSADANQAHDTGHTPLSAAAQEVGKLPALQCLVEELGADVNKGVFGGRTPLYVAAERGYVASVQYLVTELGADLDQRDDEGALPLLAAAQTGQLAVVQCLVNEFGFDVYDWDEEGETPLHISAQNGHLAVMRCLIEDLGAEIDQARGDGATALMIAASENQLKIKLSHTFLSMVPILNFLKERKEQQLIYRNLSVPPTSRPRTWRPRRTAPTLAALGPAVRSAQGASRCGTMGSSASWHTGRCTRPSAKRLQRMKPKRGISAICNIEL
jgi:hypothetical protein